MGVQEQRQVLAKSLDQGHALGVQIMDGGLILGFLKYSNDCNHKSKVMMKSEI